MKIATLAAVMLAVTVPAVWGQFGDGTYLVGVDVEPGIYRAPGGSFCTWERLSGLGGEFDDIIAMDVSENSSQLVEIKRSDKAFKVAGCGRWDPVGDTLASLSFHAAAAMALSILSGVKEVLAPGAGAVLELKLSVHEHMARIHASGYMSESEETRVGAMIDHMFEGVLWPPPQDDS